jgi:hypothetical protein
VKLRDKFSVVQGRLRLLLTSMSTEIPFPDLKTKKKAFWREGLLADNIDNQLDATIMV